MDAPGRQQPSLIQGDSGSDRSPSGGWSYYPPVGGAWGVGGLPGLDAWLWPPVTPAGWTVTVHDGSVLQPVGVEVHDGSVLQAVAVTVA